MLGLWGGRLGIVACMVVGRSGALASEIVAFDPIVAEAAGVAKCGATQPAARSAPGCAPPEAEAGPCLFRSEALTVLAPSAPSTNNCGFETPQVQQRWPARTSIRVLRQIGGLVPGRLFAAAAHQVADGGIRG